MHAKANSSSTRLACTSLQTSSLKPLRTSSTAASNARGGAGWRRPLLLRSRTSVRRVGEASTAAGSSVQNVYVQQVERLHAVGRQKLDLSPYQRRNSHDPFMVRAGGDAHACCRTRGRRKCTGFRLGKTGAEDGEEVQRA